MPEKVHYHEIIPQDDGSYIARIYSYVDGFLMENQGTEKEITAWLKDKLKE